MGSDQHRGAQPVQFDKQAHDAQAHRVIDIAGRLIGENKRRACHHGAGNGQTLLLAAGQHIGHGVEAVFQPYPVEQFGDVIMIFAKMRPMDKQRQGRVVEDIEVLKQAKILEDDAEPAAQSGGLGTIMRPDGFAEQLYHTGCRFLCQVNHPEQRGLARTGRPGEKVKRPCRQFEVQVFQDQVVFVDAGGQRFRHPQIIAQRDIMEGDHGLRLCAVTIGV